jgi:hypothetical protein
MNGRGPGSALCSLLTRWTDLISRRLVETSCGEHLNQTKQHLRSVVSQAPYRDLMHSHPLPSQENLVEEIRKRVAQLKHYETIVEAARCDTAAQYDAWQSQRRESIANASHLMPGGRSRVRPRSSDLAGLYDTAGGYQNLRNASFLKCFRCYVAKTRREIECGTHFFQEEAIGGH